ncbi:E3 ubiquitin-protein ligase TRIM39-like [Mytilus trossulus]|uniref:E3 ubiquitin-protein ligase TRIM39-like n=1 Tax=Mytilus trossulus TaxID=6551 RepID=UPI00300720DC
MATYSQSCGVCDLRHTTTPSIVWCTECDEGLCKDCQEHHSLSKASRNHSVIPIEDYQKLPLDVLKISQYCTKHNKKYEMYCQKHERSCCSKCMLQSHKECRDIVDLDDVIQNTETSNALSELEETLAEVSENLQKIRRYKQNNLSTLKERRKAIEKEIKQTKIEMNIYLDKLHEDLMKELYAAEEKENSKICQLLSSLEKKEKEIEECQKHINNIKQHATNIQMFLSVKQIEEDVSNKDKFLHSLLQGEDLKQHSLSYKLNGTIKTFMSDIKSFGEVHIEAKLCDIVLTRKKVKQAQMMVSTVHTRSIENIKFKIHKTINTRLNDIYGCCMMSDGRLAFSDFNKTIKVFNTEGLEDFQVKMPYHAYDIVHNNVDNTLVVTSDGDKTSCITIIDIETTKIKKCIALPSSNYGIALHENRLIYVGHTKGIYAINPLNESITDIVQNEMPSDCYIATFKDRIYHTNWGKNTVTCYNVQGKILWTFQENCVLANPHGIDVDEIGNLYVVGTNSRNVVVISSDGQRYKEILSASDGLRQPFTLHFSESKKQLLVAESSDKAYVFNLM